MAYLDDLYFTLNIQPSANVPLFVRLSQNENGRRLNFALAGAENTIPSGTAVTITGTKPDGVVYSKTGSITNNVVLINEDVQMTAVAGTWYAKIKLVSGGQTIASARIRFVIDADTVEPGAVPSDSQFEGLLAEAQYYAEEARGASYGAPLVANTVADMTDHTRVYVYTGSESGYTAGNWYYWNNSAWTSGGTYNNAVVGDDVFAKIVKFSELEPVEEKTRIWISEDEEEIEIPTMEDVVSPEEFNDLKSDLDAFVYPNLDAILKKKIVLTEYGSLNTNTGAEVNSDIVLRSVFIPVTENTQYKLRVENNESVQLDIHALFYDASQTYISGAIGISGSSYGGPALANSTVTLIFTTKANASYLRLRLRSYPTGTGLAKEKVILHLWTGDDEQIVYTSNLNPLIQSINNSLLYKGNIATAGLDLNSGDFIHSGMWYVNVLAYLPKNCPTTKRCRIISYASSTDNPVATYQTVIDSDYNIFTRYNNGLSDGGWSNWRKTTAYHPNAFECLFTNPAPFQNDYVINRLNKSETNRVSKLYALYDVVTEDGVTIIKDTLGMDATNAFNIYNYKVSLNTGEKPVVLVICGEHGDELTSAYLGYYLYMEIVKGALKKYLRYVDFWVVPLMNPYGYENATRNNGNDVNLNRDFPALWSYSTSSHNKTGDYSLSQPETQIIYNLLVNNKDKILFMCNKHDTGSITSKITSAQEDIVAYVSTVLECDHVVNNGIATWENQQVRETDPWIIDDCTTDISHITLIASRTVATPGTLDVFANSIGIHGSLLEVSGSAYYTGESQIYPDGQFRYKELARLGLDFFVNYIGTTIEKNSELLENDNLTTPRMPYYTRKQVDGEWITTEMYWNGSQLLEV